MKFSICAVGTIASLALATTASPTQDSESQCYTAFPGDGTDCSKAIEWAKKDGIRTNPEGYPGLDAGVSYYDFQLFLEKEDNGRQCPKPCSRDPTTPEAPIPQEMMGRTLKWSDEFFAPISKNDWTYDYGNGVNGWGNGEDQYYSDDEKYISTQNGILKINAIKEADGKWYSGKMVTQGKHEFKFGYAETRCRLPGHYTMEGAFPAVWMLGNKGTWPENGEIDMFEYQKAFGGVPSTLHFPKHHAKDSVGLGQQYDSASDWHTYGIEWNETSITAYHDGIRLKTYHVPLEEQNNWNFPYNQEGKDFYFMVNLAVGPNFGPNAATNWDDKKYTFE
eukprot:Pgem_evm1s17527